MLETLPPPPESIPGAGAPPRPGRRIAGLVAAVSGGLLLLLGLCSALAYLIAPVQNPLDALANNILLASVSAMGLIFGFLILLVGVTAARGGALRPLRLPSALFFLAAFVLVLVLGQFILSLNLAPAYFFPPWHILASALLPIAVLAFAIHHLPSIGGQTELAEFAWGGLGSILLSLVFELIAGAVILVAAALVLIVLLGPEQVMQLLDQFRSLPNGTRDLGRIISLLSRQPATLITGGLAAIALLVVVAPLIEETLKAAGPAALIARARPTATTALLWGLTAGAGYAFSENLLNGASSATPQPCVGNLWALAMGLRGGTSLVHMAATATVSLGWYVGIVQRQRLYFFLYYLVGWMGHGLWNMVALLPVAAFPDVGADCNSTAALSGPGALLSLFALLVFGLILLAAALWIVWLVRWTKRIDRREAAGASSG